MQPKRWLASWTTPEDESKDHASKSMKSSRHDNTGVLAFDMIIKEADLYRIVGAITMPTKIVAPIRTYCMNCKVSTVRPTTTTSMTKLIASSLVVSSKSSPTPGVATKLMHCRHCSRSVCTNCCKTYLPIDAFGKNFRTDPMSFTPNGSPPKVWPCCVVCEKILMSRKEIMSHGTQPTTTTTTSYGSSGPGGINDFLFESYDNDDTDRYSC